MNKLYLGDNLDVLKKQIPDSSVDLIYLDPPFNSKRNYFRSSRGNELNVEKSKVISFKDIWKWNSEVETAFETFCGRAEKPLASFLLFLKNSSKQKDLLFYLLFLSERIVEMNRCLKNTGSIYLHCDPKVSPYLRLMLDSIFGVNNFLNEIVWSYGLGGSSKRVWSRKHDVILWYSKILDKYYFKPVMVPAKSFKMKGQLKKESDSWFIPTLNNMAKERNGYPTQKPIELLCKIVKSSSKEGDIIMDPFCGSGTTLVAAKQLNRNWIGIDNNPEAIEISQTRIDNETKLRQ